MYAMFNGVSVLYNKHLTSLASWTLVPSPDYYVGIYRRGGAGQTRYRPATEYTNYSVAAQPLEYCGKSEYHKLAITKSMGEDCHEGSIIL